VEIKSCLLGFFTKSKYFDFCKGKYSQFLKGAKDLVQAPDGVEDNEYILALTVENNQPDGKISTHLKFKLPLKHLEHVLEKGWIESYQGEAPEISPKHIWDQLTPLKGKDYQQIKVYYRLVLGMCIYLTAIPNSLYPGLPNSIHSREIPIFLKNAKNHIAHMEKTIHASPGAHLRQWHFRTLKHKKFARNPDGTCRIIRIPSAEGVQFIQVGRKLDSETIKK
jgi:hypothetical protein